jgi:antitoxin HicB
MSQKFYSIAVIELPADDGGGYLAYVPDLPGCMSDGDTPEEAFANARQAVDEWIEDAAKRNQEIPQPGSAAKVATADRQHLVEKIREQSTTIESFDRELKELRSSLEAMTERLEMLQCEPMMWATPIENLLAHRRSIADDSVH